MIQKEVFFIEANRVEGITEEDYLRAKPYIETAQAFAQTTYQSIYIIDYFKKDFLYVSDNPIFLCGRTAEEVKAMGYGFYLNQVPEIEIPMLTELNQAGFSAFNATPREDKMRCLMSYDFHILSNKKKLLVNHKITPLLLNELGQVWLALCTVSLSSHKEAGHIEFRRMGTSQHQVYSLTEHQWIPQEEIRLKTEEKEVLVLSARGYTMKEIAEKVCKSIDTVKFYRKQVFEKLEVENITEALSFAINYGLL